MMELACDRNNLSYLMAAAPEPKGWFGVRLLRKEETWHINKVVAVDSAGHGRCTRQFARSARKSAKSRLNPEMIVRYTARIVIQSARTKAVKRRDLVNLLLLADPQR